MTMTLSQNCVNNKNNHNYDNLSRNNRRFIEVNGREAARIYRYYQLPIPLKDKELVPLNSRMTAYEAHAVSKEEV